MFGRQPINTLYIVGSSSPNVDWILCAKFRCLKNTHIVIVLYHYKPSLNLLHHQHKVQAHNTVVNILRWCKSQLPMSNILHHYTLSTGDVCRTHTHRERDVHTYSCNMTTSNLVVSELRYEACFTNTTVATEQHLEQVVVVTVNVGRHLGTNYTSAYYNSQLV